MRPARWLVCLLLVPVVAQTGCTIVSVDKRAYTARNQAIMESLPLYPGARFETAFTMKDQGGNGWPCENCGPATAYQSYRFYRLPAGTDPQAVLAFYERRMPVRWEPQLGPMPCEQTYKRDAAEVYVSACNGRLDLNVDHAAFSD
jgi:hypothetical protein